MSDRATLEKIEVDTKEYLSIIERIRSRLNDDEYDKMIGLVKTLEFVLSVLEYKNMTLKKLRALFFGNKSEKTKDVLNKTDQDAEPTKNDSASNDTQPKEKQGKKKKRKGHGRNGTKAYRGAERRSVAHPSLKPKDSCPECGRGKVYPMPPKKLVRFRGQAPIGAIVHELERLRCNLCGIVFTAPQPKDIGSQRYDETAKSMIALLKYGCGLPFNRIQRLQENLGIPLPDATQWDLVEDLKKDSLSPIYDKLLDRAAEGSLFLNDDTGSKILSLMRENKEHAARGDPPERTGIFTSGIVSKTPEGKRIALYFTGRKHAGENLNDLLARRQTASPPIQMCDAAARNLPKDARTKVANCMAHARRGFVSVADSFPTEVEHVLLLLGEVYKNDAQAKKRRLSDEQRLRFHQENSESIMRQLHRWLTTLFDQKRVEPNSSLGRAINYMLKRWDRMTLFLREPGVPLDNNLCERFLKIAILHRKNAMFYKTENGAQVGDVFMSLIATCMLAKVNALHYLTTLQRYKDDIRRNPDAWLPWNYLDNLPQAQLA